MPKILRKQSLTLYYRIKHKTYTIRYKIYLSDLFASEHNLTLTSR